MNRQTKDLEYPHDPDGALWDRMKGPGSDTWGQHPRTKSKFINNANEHQRM